MAEVLVIGGGGLLGREVAASAARSGHRVSAPGRDELDLLDSERVRSWIGSSSPDLIINCAALTDVDGCEERESEAFEINGHAVGRLGQAVDEECDGILIHVSTDYVFDGLGTAPYREDDPTSPASVYGKSKLLGEQQLRGRRAIVVRTSWLFGRGGKSFVSTIAARVRRGEELRVVADQTGAPTYAGFLAEALLEVGALWLSQGDPPALLHYRNREPATWFDLALQIAELWPYAADGSKASAPAKVIPVSTADFPRPAPRPAYSVLSVDRFEAVTGRRVEPWRVGLEQYRQLEIREEAAASETPA